MDGNSWSRILKNGFELKRVYEQNILHPYRLTKVVVEVTTDGSIKVFTSNNPWIPLITVIGTPVQVKYISFASTRRVQFFYETDEHALLTVPVKQVSTENLFYMKHPLFNVVDYPVGLADLCKFFFFIFYLKERMIHFVAFLFFYRLPKIL